VKETMSLHNGTRILVSPELETIPWFLMIQIRPRVGTRVKRRHQYSSKVLVLKPLRFFNGLYNRPFVFYAYGYLFPL
jgi:hypothetical protein